MSAERAKDLVGRRVRLLQRVETRGGDIWDENEVLTVESTWRGRFTLRACDPEDGRKGIRHARRLTFHPLPIVADPNQVSIDFEMVRTRRYCWMVGAAFESEDDGLCPECCQPFGEHFEIKDGKCGSFARCPDCVRDSRAHGHPCTLPAGHEGAHQAWVKTVEPQCPTVRAEAADEMLQTEVGSSE